MKILVLDNYDSFTYNLVHYLQATSHANVEVFRNNQISIRKINNYDKILISPGPGLPSSSSGILMEMINEYYTRKNMLGICLGHQAIGEMFGGKLKNLETVYHGAVAEMKIIIKDKLFNHIPRKFKAVRYHSWILDNENFPKELEVTVQDDKGRIMGLRHKKFNLRGIQFHPESILTEYGKQIIANWVNS